MHKWFTESGEHIFWSEICNNVTYVANHDPHHKVIISYNVSDNKLYTITMYLISSIEPYKEVYYYGKLLDSPPVDLYAAAFKEVDGAVQTALSARQYSSLTRGKPNLILDLKESTTTPNRPKHFTHFIKSLGF